MKPKKLKWRVTDDFGTSLVRIVWRVVPLAVLAVAALWLGPRGGGEAAPDQSELCLPASSSEDAWINRIGTPPVIYDKTRATGPTGTEGPVRPDCRIQVLDSGLAQGRGIVAVPDAPPNHHLIVVDAWEGLYKYPLHGAESRQRPAKLPNIEVCPEGHCSDVDHRGLIYDTSRGGQKLLLVETHQQRVSVRDMNGTFLESFGGGALLEGVTDAALYDQDTLFVTTVPRDAGPSSDDAKRLGRLLILPRAGTPKVLPGDFERPVGISYSKCQRRIYVADAGRDEAVWYYYEPRGAEWQRAGVLASHPSDRGATLPALMGIAIAPCGQGTPSADGGPGAQTGGEIFAAGPGGLFVFHPDGTLLARYILSERISGLTWGLAERQDDTMLYMTVGHRIARLRTNVQRSSDR